MMQLGMRQNYLLSTSTVGLQQVTSSWLPAEKHTVSFFAHFPSDFGIFLWGCVYSIYLLQ